MDPRRHGKPRFQAMRSAAHLKRGGSIHIFVYEPTSLAHVKGLLRHEFGSKPPKRRVRTTIIKPKETTSE